MLGLSYEGDDRSRNFCIRVISRDSVTGDGIILPTSMIIEL